ncbi:MAG: hypothetical protein EA355_00415 [Rhodobacteraceae bacterium]|nr:MAG: hypothetical protein EA355_00415 [Paracoccaceae bacterium]
MSFGWSAAEAVASDEAVRLLSYEATPSVQAPVDLGGSSYEQREALARAALDEIVPEIMAAVGVDAAALETQVTPGGYLLRTNASLQTRGLLSEAEANRLAAALGYVFRQWSVMVSRLEDGDGDTGYVSVGFPAGALTPALAQGFFTHAAGVKEGLGGGYTAFGDVMVFLNVRDGSGAPYSGLGDMEFAARLGTAAGTFPDAQAKIADAGFASAVFVGNDWARATEGEDYAALLGDDAEAIAALDALRAAHDALVLRMGEAFGWD